MAKIKSPLFSLNAIGTVDKKLIYRKRKKFDDVKKYTKTINPNMPGQQRQKGYFKEAILEWQTAGYSRFDIQAWDVYARSKKVNASGFNMFTGLKINAEKEEKTWTKLKNCNIYDVKAESFKVDINVESDLSGILYLGTSKFSMLKEFEGTFSINKYNFIITGLTKLNKYYFYVKNNAIGEVARTGIFKVKTSEKGPPIDITIGAPAINRPLSTGKLWTQIGCTSPANSSGKITNVEFFTGVSLGGLIIAIFYGTVDNVTARDRVILGDFTTPGYYSRPVNLDVEEGDVIGFYLKYGSIDSDIGGVWWRKVGDNTECKNAVFEERDQIISLHGTGKG